MLAFYENKTQYLYAAQQAPYAFPLHLHTHLEVVFVTSGSFTIHIQGNDWALHQGDCAIVFPNMLHAFLDGSADCNIIMLLLSPSLIGRYFDTLLQYMPVTPVLQKKAMHSDIYFAIHGLLRESIEKNKNEESVARALTQLLLAQTLAMVSLSKRQLSAQIILMSELISYLYLHYQEPLSLDSVSAAFGVSSYTISRIFTRHLQISFTEYVNTLRIEHAKELLAHSQDTISNVSIQSGFSTLRTFNRVFQTQCGLSPKEYRANTLPHEA